MQLGMIGLGKMGANMVRRLLNNDHSCVVFDSSPKAVDELVQEKAIGSATLPEFVQWVAALVHSSAPGWLQSRLPHFAGQDQAGIRAAHRLAHHASTSAQTVRPHRFPLRLIQFSMGTGLAVSVLDLVSMRAGESAGSSIARSVDLVQHVEQYEHEDRLQSYRRVADVATLIEAKPSVTVGA